MSRLRALTLLFCVLAMSVALAACGGGGGDSTSGGDSSENPQTVLNQTFDNNATIKSADIDLSVDVDSPGDQGGKFTASLSGPVDGSGEGFPKFDLTGKVSGSGGGQDIDFEGGLTSTGTAAYVSYGGSDYAVDDQTFDYLRQSYEQGQTQQTQSSDLSAFKDVLTNVTNEGTTDVEGTETVEVSGDVDVQKLVAAIRPLAEQAQQLGSVTGGSVPSPSDLDSLEQYVKSATFSVYSGTDDHLLRKLEATIDLDDTASDQTASISFDLTLGSVNEPQEVSAPSGAKPLSDLIGGDLGSMLGGGALGGGSSTGGTSSGLTPAQAQCLQTATLYEEIQACLQK